MEEEDGEKEEEEWEEESRDVPRSWDSEKLESHAGQRGKAVEEEEKAGSLEGMWTKRGKKRNATLTCHQ